MEQINENEEKKEYLKAYGDAVTAYECIRKEIQTLREIQTSVSIRYSDMPGSGSRSGADLSTYTEKLDELERKLAGEEEKKIKTFLGILKNIEMMEDEESKNILRMRYIQRMTWDNICQVVGCSWKGVHRKHAKALNNFKIF